ncbi:MAG: hypothetical protein KatS3mg131_0942 [Candidatus Tectimicrobiota bacterium]|nr:MAG: hypothetical protein KatS3mg131_0942 [Candidatus Tectomicrobia bacterium]
MSQPTTRVPRRRHGGLAPLLALVILLVLGSGVARGLGTAERDLLILVADLSKGYDAPAQQAFYQLVGFAAEAAAATTLKPLYREIHVLKGGQATLAMLRSRLHTVTANAAVKAVDVIFVTHGLDSRLYFTDRAHTSAEVRDQIRTLPEAQRAKLRMLFSTACYGSTHINDWLQAGFKVVSGSKRIYADSALSYPAFLGAWALGQSFAQAAAAANAADPLRVQDKAAMEVLRQWKHPSWQDVDSTRVVGGNGALTINSAVVPSSTPTVARTGLVGGNGGRDFERSCAAGEVLVGLKGRSGWWLDQVQVQCVRIDGQGRWSSGVVTRGSAGGNGGNPFTRTCSSGYAVVGFDGKAGSYVDRLELRCRKLTGASSTSGSEVALAAVGGNGGRDFSAKRCPSSRPAVGIYGRSGSYVDAFGLVCR